MAIPTSRTDKNAEIIIDRNKCNLCGICVDICKDFSLKIENNKLVVSREPLFGCFGCGQCAAVCPSGAIVVEGRTLSAEDFIKQPHRSSRAGYNELYNLLVSRRSIRDFKNKPVEQELIDKILNAASTARNPRTRSTSWTCRRNTPTCGPRPRSCPTSRRCPTACSSCRATPSAVAGIETGAGVSARSRCAARDTWRAWPSPDQANDIRSHPACRSDVFVHRLHDEHHHDRGDAGERRVFEHAEAGMPHRQRRKQLRHSRSPFPSSRSRTGVAAPLNLASWASRRWRRWI